jgi:hypothetical protein
VFSLANANEMGGIVASKKSTYPTGTGQNRATFVCDATNVLEGNVCPQDRTPQCPQGATLPAGETLPRPVFPYRRLRDTGGSGVAEG